MTPRFYLLMAYAEVILHRLLAMGRATALREINLSRPVKVERLVERTLQ